MALPRTYREKHAPESGTFFDQPQPPAVVLNIVFYMCVGVPKNPFVSPWPDWAHPLGKLRKPLSGSGVERTTLSLDFYLLTFGWKRDMLLLSLAFRGFS